MIVAAEHGEMASRADFGLMVWDGISSGTCLNVLRLAILGSPCVVYDTMRGTVGTVHTIADWRAMLQHAGSETRRDVEARMTADERVALEPDRGEPS